MQRITGKCRALRESGAYGRDEGDGDEGCPRT